MFVSARSLDEYVGMFSLGSHELSASFLDCGAGCSSFTAEMNHSGQEAHAVDILYGETTDAVLDAGISGIVEARRNLVNDASNYEWGPTFRDPYHHSVARLTSLAKFLNDYRSHGPKRYTSSRLEALPFPSGSFDMCLSSHVLFTNIDQIPISNHVRIFREMLRVARKEVRIYPLVGYWEDASEALVACEREARSLGHKVEILSADYRFLRDADSFLRVTIASE